MLDCERKFLDFLTSYIKLLLSNRASRVSYKTIVSVAKTVEDLQIG